MKRLLVIAGPNGSGKSSILDKIILLPRFPEVFIGPDEIVKSPEFQHIKDEKTRYIAAMTRAEIMRRNAIYSGRSLAFETVFSTDEKLDFILEAKGLGYLIDIIFVSTNDPDINVSRVNSRVKAGGHSVPLDKIYSRYEKSLSYIPKLFEVADKLVIYDNSVDDKLPLPVLLKTPKSVYNLNIDLVSQVWVFTYITETLKSIGINTESFLKLNSQQSDALYILGDVLNLL